MKNPTQSALLLAANAALAFSTASAAVIYYDGTLGNADLDVTIASDGSNAITTITGDLGANSWVDPDTSAAGANATYVGGRISLSGYNIGSWNDPPISIGLATDAEIQFSGSTWAARLHMYPDSGDWRALGFFSSALDVQPANSTFEFIIKIYDDVNNTSAVAVFLGSNATAATEGAPDYILSGPGNIFSGNDPYASVVNGFRLEFQKDGDAILTTSNMFSSTTWTPVPAAPLEVATSSLPEGTVASAYSQALSANGGIGTLSWSVTSGSLPAGLTLSSAGLISGTPSAAGTSNFTVTVTDATLATDSQALSLVINPPVSNVVYYDGTGGHGNLNASFTTTGTTGQVAVDAAHRYYPTVTEAMYYGGSVVFDRSGGEWNGTRFQFLIGNAADPWTYSPMYGSDSALLMAGDGQTSWRFGGSTEWFWASVQDTGISANTPGSFDFVIKLEKKSPWSEVRMKIFLGAKATAATEGTPDLVAEFNAFNLTMDYMSWSFNAGSGTPSLTTSNMFSASVWTPVPSGGGGYATWASANGIAGQPAGGDFDKDGLTNLMEYALDLDPIVSTTPAGTFNGTTVSFAKGADAVTNGDVTYAIETSPDLEDPWTTVTPTVNTPTTISYDFPGEPLFARLRVTQVP